MLEKLLELLTNLGSVASPLVIVHQWQKAGLLRFGRYRRTLEPGYHWKWPFVEDAIEVDTCITTLRLPPQSLTTKDRRQVVVSTVIKYEITDIRPYVCDIWDQKDVLADVAMGAIARAIIALTFDELVNNPPTEAVIRAIRNEVNRFGFRLHKVTFPDIAAAKSLRLVQALGKDIDN